MLGVVARPSRYSNSDDFSVTHPVLGATGDQCECAVEGLSSGREPNSTSTVFLHTRAVDRNRIYTGGPIPTASTLIRPSDVERSLFIGQNASATRRVAGNVLLVPGEPIISR
jgi:hypothetical protein